MCESQISDFFFFTQSVSGTDENDNWPEFSILFFNKDYMKEDLVFFLGDSQTPNINFCVSSAAFILVAH